MLSSQDLAPQSPFSEMGPADSPFGGPRRATIASASTLSGAPLFSAPFGSSNQIISPAARDASPFGENGSSFNQWPFGAQASSTEDNHDEPIIPSYALGRRTSVSAESLVPANQRTIPSAGHLESTLEEDENTPNPNKTMTPTFPKTDEQLARIRTAIKPNFLFRNLDDEQERDVLAAMKEVSIGSGEMVIEQGAAGDYFYVVESGKLEVFVKRDGQVIDPEKGDKPGLGKKVAICVEGSSFGELALMHKWVIFIQLIWLTSQSAPRAASIISLSPGTLWALDRVSFRTILLDVSEISSSILPCSGLSIAAYLPQTSTLRVVLERGLNPCFPSNTRTRQDSRRTRVPYICRRRECHCGR